MGDLSVELCGGTHVSRTGDIGMLRITSEGGVAAGVRRIEAVTGARAVAAANEDARALQRIGDSIKAPREKLEEKVSQILDRNKSLEKELTRLQQKLAGQSSEQLDSKAVDVEGVRVLAVQLEGTPDNKILRDTADKLCDKLGDAAIVLAGVNGDKVSLVARVAKPLTGKIKAGEMINTVAAQVGGRGGGRPDMAQAGGNQPENVPGALASVADWVRQQVTG